MKNERSNVEFPLWRKKVDKSLFEHRGTTIPTWACKMWGLPDLFRTVSSRKDKKAKTTIKFMDKAYVGYVTVAAQGRKTPAYRLWFEEDLQHRLKYTFLMSYMRSLEQSLTEVEDLDIEHKIPFWEFLDIEFDKENKLFRFVAYYKQDPTFPGLFERLIGSPALQKISEELEGKGNERIYKQDWKRREELKFEIGSKNVVYMLLDTEHKLLYVGEAQDLLSRLSQPHSLIEGWNYFRYDVLPDSLSKFRVDIERMMIRDLASVFTNERGVQNLLGTEFRLVNKKIDK
jgi:hypothetical protein